MNNVGRQIRNRVHDRIITQMESRIEAQVSPQAEAHIWKQVWDEFKSKISFRTYIVNSLNPSQHTLRRPRRFQPSSIIDTVKNGRIAKVRDWWINFHLRKYNDEDIISFVEMLYKMTGFDKPEVEILPSPNACHLAAEKIVGNFVHPGMCGDIGDTWMSYYDFFCGEEDIKISQSIRNYVSAFKKSMTFYTIQLEKICFVSRYPTRISWDEEGSGLVSDAEKPAVQFEDGYSTYIVDGIPFDEELWKRSFASKMPARDIIGIDNVEQRTVVINHYGLTYLMDDLDAKVIDEVEYLSKIDGEPCNYCLISYNLNPLMSRSRTERVERKAVQVEDHTTHKIATLLVPVEMETCMEAIAWTFGMERDEYISRLEMES